MKNLGKDKKQNLWILLVYVLILIVFRTRSSYFLRSANLAAMLVAAVPLGLIAISEGLCLLTRNLDMATGMIASLAGVTWALLITRAGMNLWIALVLGLLYGAIAGLLSGILVAYMRLPAFIATYAMMLIWRGIIHVLTNGEAISMRGNKEFKILGQTKIFGTELTLPVVILIIVFIAAHLMMKYSRFGRSLYIIGGNRDAAVNTGININLTLCCVFVISGTLAALAGLLFASRANSAQAIIGETYAMQGIAATVVGGTKMEGGKASMAMTFIGVLIVIAIQNGLNMAGVNNFFQYIANGLIVFAAVLIQTDRRGI